MIENVCNKNFDIFAILQFMRNKNTLPNLQLSSL